MGIATNATLVMVFSLHFSVAACKLFVYRDWLVLGEFFFLLRYHLYWKRGLFICRHVHVSTSNLRACNGL